MIFQLIWKSKKSIFDNWFFDFFWQKRILIVFNIRFSGTNTSFLMETIYNSPMHLYIHCYGLTSKQDLSTIQRHLQFLRSALTTWTARNSLPSLPKVHLDDLWQRSNLTTSHSTTTSPTRTSHASSSSSRRLSFIMKTNGLHPCGFIAPWSTSSVSPRPSPTH